MIVRDSPRLETSNIFRSSRLTLWMQIPPPKDGWFSAAFVGSRQGKRLDGCQP